MAARKFIEKIATSNGLVVSGSVVADYVGGVDVAQGSGGGTSSFLRADGVWAVPPGTGIGSGGGTVTSIDVSGASTGLTFTGGPLTTMGVITLGGTLIVANGGTGLGTLTAHGVMLGEGTTAVGFATVGTAGRMLLDQGASADPAFETMTGDATLAGTGALTLATVNSNVGTFQGLTVNAKGLVTAAVAQGYLTANQTITLSGDTTGSGTTAITTTTGKVNGVTYPPAPAINTVPVVTSASSGGTVTYEAVPNAALANSAVTVTAGTGLSGGGSVSLGSSVTLNLAATIPQAEAIVLTDAVTNAVITVLTIGHASSGMPAAGFGLNTIWTLQDSTNTTITTARMTLSWVVATHGSACARADWYVSDSAGQRLYLSAQASGSAAMIGVLGATPAIQQTGDAGTALVTFGWMSGTPTFAGANLTGTTLPTSFVTSSLTRVGTSLGIGLAPSFALDVTAAQASSYTARISNTSDSTGSDGLAIRCGSTTTGGAHFVDFFLQTGGGVIGSVSQSGTTAVLFNTTSDERLKEGIVDTTIGLATLEQIRVRDFSFRADPAGHVLQGFVAQELHAVYPEAVTHGGVDPHAKPWGVDYGRITPLLVRAVQELSVRVKQLEALLLEYPPGR
jgi:hypothetical protein